MFSSRVALTTLRQVVVVGPTLDHSLSPPSSFICEISKRSLCAVASVPPPKKNKTKVKTKSGNVRGSRGHGWFHHYRNNGGGRHLQGDYADGRRPPIEELEAWNQQILNLGKVTAYLDVTVGANQVTTLTAADTTSISPISNSSESSQSDEDTKIRNTESEEGTETLVAENEKQHEAAEKVTEEAKEDEENEKQDEAAEIVAEETKEDEEEEPPVVEVQRHRLYMDIATKAMPMTTRNFLELCQQSTLGYTNTVFHRLDKRVGLLGGDVASNTGSSGRCATSFLESSTSATSTVSGCYLFNEDHHVMTHIGGAISMLCPKVKTVDSRFIIITQPDAPHLDGYHLAFGQLHPESLALVQSWVKTIFTKQGHPLTELRIVQCGILDEVDNDSSTNQDGPSKVTDGTTEQKVKEMAQ